MPINDLNMTTTTTYPIGTVYPNSNQFHYWSPSYCYRGCNCHPYDEKEIAEMQKLALAIDPSEEDEPLPSMIELLKLARYRIRELEKELNEK